MMTFKAILPAELQRRQSSPSLEKLQDPQEPNEILDRIAILKRERTAAKTGHK